MSQEANATVIVVGAGNAALVAALSAREEGADVIVLESASKEERGGNSRFSGGIFRACHEGLESLVPIVCEESRHWIERVSVGSYPKEDFLRDWTRVTEGRANRELMDIVTDGSFETLRWMQRLGVKWELGVGKLFDESKLGEGVKIVLSPGGAIRSREEGVGLMEELYKATENAGIQIWYESPAVGLLTSGSTVDGVRIRAKDRFIEVRGTVVLACGGFESNPAMRRTYLGPGWDVAKVRGTRFNMGTMLNEALAIGAQPIGHWGAAHASPIDAAAPPFGDIALTDKLSRYSYPYSLMINRNGERFVDEGSEQVWLTYAKTGAAIQAQPGGIAFQVFDQQTAHLLEPRYSTGTPIVAADLDELADKLEVPLGALQSTIEAFNEAVAPDAKERFNPVANDGVSALPADQPGKSNWALPLEQPPFVVYPCACGTTFTFGGLKIDADARVIDTEGRVMPGLYAAGEITGDFFYFNYAAGTGLMRGAVFGRIAGARAAHFEPGVCSPE